jgi:hypothetical protein
MNDVINKNSIIRKSDQSSETGKRDERKIAGRVPYRRVEAVEALVLVNPVVAAGRLDPVQVRRHHIHTAALEASGQGGKKSQGSNPSPTV